MKKIWCWITALSLVLGLCTPFGGLVPPAAAEEPGETRTGYCGAWVWDEETDAEQYGENLTWTLTGDTLTISGQGEMAEWNRGAEAPWAQYCEEIRHVVIGNGVINIGACAFGLNSIAPRSLTEPESSGYAIETVDLGNTVQAIGYSAFAGCQELNAVEIPASVKSIDRSFTGCTALTEVSFDPDVKIAEMYYAFSGCTNLETVEIPACAPDDYEDDFLRLSYAFENCTSLTEVTFRKGAMLVDNGMFSGCTSLTTVHLPSSVAKVDASAFEGCDRLADIHYDGYADEWAAILDEEWYPLPDTVTVHCL